MQKIINFRPFLFTALFAIFAVIGGALFATVNNVLGIVIGCVLAGLSIVLCIVFRKNPIRLTTFILCAVISVGCFLYSGLYLMDRNTVNVYEEDVSITGRVCEVVSHDTNHSVVLENLVIDGDVVSGKMCVRFNENDKIVSYIRVGDKVSLVSKPITSKVKFEDFSFNDIKYYAYCAIDNVSVTAGTLSFRDRILGSLRSTYNKWLGKYGDLAYSIITGDKNGLTNSFRSAYSVSGLSHILAVSGLHVGFLMSLVCLFLRAIKVNKKVQPWICAVILLAYNFLVGFSFSIIRASIMFMIAFIARILGKQNDRLNNLSLAVSIILCIFPYSLFDVGFLMSVGCVFAITVFSDSLTGILLKITKNKCQKLISAISVSICAQLGVFPATTLYFSSFAPYSVIANIVAMPVLNVIYVYVLLMGILSTFLPFMGYVLHLSAYLFIAIDYLNIFIGSLPFSEITIYGTLGILSFYLLYFISSRFFMVPKKFIAIIMCIVLASGIILADNLRFNGEVHLVYANARYDVTTLIKTGDSYAIVGDVTKSCKIESCVNNVRAHKIDSIYVTYLNANNVYFIARLADKYNVDAVYVRDSSPAEQVQLLVQNNVTVKLTSSQNLLREIEEDGKFVGYKYKNVLMTSYKTDMDKLSRQYLSTYSLVRAYSYKETAGACFALNYTDEEIDNAVGANEDTVLLDCSTLALKRF